MTKANSPTSPKAPEDEALPWEKLYDATIAGWEHPWNEQKNRIIEANLQIFERCWGEYPVLPKAPISLELLISTATALRPMFGASDRPPSEKDTPNEQAVREAYDLLFRCGELWRKAEERAGARVAATTATFGKYRKVRLSEAVKTITGYKSPVDANHYFRVLLEVLYGEALAWHERPELAALADEDGELAKNHFLPIPFDERGDYKSYAAFLQKFYETGIPEEHVPKLAERFMKLIKEGFLKKSTSRPLSRTNSKKRKQKATRAKHS